MELFQTTRAYIQENFFFVCSDLVTWKPQKTFSNDKREICFEQLENVHQQQKRITSKAYQTEVDWCDVFVMTFSHENILSLQTKR